MTAMPAGSEPASACAAYLARHALHPPQAAEPPAEGLGLAVVIPSHDEPDLLDTLESLWACARPERPAEVIVALNRPADAEPGLRRRHGEQAAAARAWAGAHGDGQLRFHVLDFPALPPRHAGVGLARKLGMDEAVRRLAAAGNEAAPIACLDADCRVTPDYLRALEAHFAAHPGSPACSLHFEHDWAALSDPRGREGIVQYELHLRCGVAGLRLAGHPHAFHTVGSAMAVRADAYARQGGMNRRKGAEDFHFLAKLMPLGGFTVLAGATVLPSARRSHRVPFGTGRAMTDWLAGDDPMLCTHAVQSYRDLGALMAGLPRLWNPEAGATAAFLSSLPAPLAAFLRQGGFEAQVGEIRRNTASPNTFRQRLLRRVDRFRILKWLRYAREHHYPDAPVEAAAAELLEWAGRPVPGGNGFERRTALLRRFREWDAQIPGEGD